MAQLVLEISEALAEQLERMAAEQQKSPEQLAVERLESAVAPAMTLEERYDRFFKESGLFVQVPEEVKRRYKPVSEEHRRELAAKLGAAGPLSELIIQERKTR